MEKIKKIDLSIILVCKNEAKNLEYIIPVLLDHSDEVILVDGHSNDGTMELCKKFNIKFLLDNKIGKGDAQKIAIKEAKNKYVLFVDGDGSHDLEDIDKLYNEVKYNNFDLAIGSRMSGGSLDIISNTSFIGFIRFVGNNFLVLLFNKIFKSCLTEVLYSFRCVNKDSFLKANITANKFDIELDMLIKFKLKKFRITEIPSREFKRIHGVSKLNTLVGIFFIFQILKYLFVKK